MKYNPPPLVSVNYGVLKRPPLSSNDTFTLHVKFERPFAHQGVSFRFGVLPLCIVLFHIVVGPLMISRHVGFFANIPTSFS